SDVTAPTSSASPLPATIRSTTFRVFWSGADNAGGSGLATFDVFVSDNGGAFVPFLTGTTQTSELFTGVVGHTYGFKTVATDVQGNREATPVAAQTETTVAALPPFARPAAL